MTAMKKGGSKKKRPTRARKTTVRKTARIEPPVEAKSEASLPKAARLSDAEKPGVATHEGEVVVTQVRQYAGVLGKEYICEVSNIEHPGKDSIIWTVSVNGDMRQFINGQKVQLAAAHIKALKKAVIVDQIPISSDSGYYFDKAEAEAQNPGMRYVIEKGMPYMIREKRRYMWSILGPAVEQAGFRGGLSKKAVEKALGKDFGGIEGLL